MVKGGEVTVTYITAKNIIVSKVITLFNDVTLNIRGLIDLSRSFVDHKLFTGQFES